MKTKWYIIICLFSACIGILFLALQQEIIVINYPKNSINKKSSLKATKKIASLVYWQNDEWKTEKQELIWHADSNKNLYYLINSLLTLLHEEKVMHKKVNLQSVLLSVSGHEAYLSFDRNPLVKQQAIFTKLIFIESILKTIKQNKIPIQQVQFLVHHQVLHDTHLDFSKPWNINGFLN